MEPRSRQVDEGIGTMEANRQAPIFSEGRIEIAAHPERVWDLLADVDRWPDWNPDVRSAELDGPIAEGSVFRWKSGPGTIVSTFRRVERPTELAWTGRTFGIRAVHVWRFERREANTVVTMEESFEGLVASVLRGPLQKQLDATTAKGLGVLKARAETPA